jgi:ABC-type multidrug transport system ATPase subunit
MRCQGFVSQHDNLLSTLSVWQTLMYAALLRLPEEMTSRQKLCRFCLVSFHCLLCFYLFIDRAAYIMEDVGLSNVCHNLVGDIHGGTGNGQGGGASTGGSGAKSISGGQRRRLSIAVELLSNPAAITLDEPTSGLDAASSLKIVKSLRSMSRKYKAIICLSIHQPRSEVFGLFDYLLLLGTGGYLVYYGPSASAASILASSPIVDTAFFSTENPGDFIIDILGLASDEVEIVSSIPLLQEDSASSSSVNDATTEESTTTRIIENERHIHDYPPVDEETKEQMQTLVSTDSLPSSVLSPLARPTRIINEADTDQNRHLRTLKLHEYFLTTTSYADLLTDLSPILKAGRGATTRLVEEDNSSFTSSRNRDVVRDDNDIEMVNMTGQSTHGLLSSSSRRSDETDPPRNRIRLPQFSSSSFNNNLPSVFGGNQEDNSHGTHSLSLQERFRYPAATSTQIWVLFCRRVQVSLFRNRFSSSIYISFFSFLLCLLKAFLPSVQDAFYLFLQMICVAIIVSVTFSYQIDNEMEPPYQVIMLLSVIALYAMILQYLILIPEYMTERPIISNEIISKYISVSSYITSTMLTEIPRVIIQVFLLLSILYHLHPLNPNHINRNFTYICLIVGVVAFQSLINFTSMMTDSISVAYTVTFLILGSGTLFGGLLVRYSKIPSMFQFLYYVSITAVTQRALITNDLQCCYLTVTCNTLAKDYYASSSSSSSANPFTNSTLNTVTTNFCPPGLGFTGDGSDDGNLGRVYLIVRQFSLAVFLF